MKLRNASADTLMVPLVGAIVAPDEVVDIPDEVYASYAWPDYWVEAGPSKKTVKEA